jgi:hypothetical protein
MYSFAIGCEGDAYRPIATIFFFSFTHNIGLKTINLSHFRTLLSVTNQTYLTPALIHGHKIYQYATKTL